jgi:hypothetical protein
MRRVVVFALFVMFVAMVPATASTRSASAAGLLLPSWKPAEVPFTAMAGSDVAVAVKQHATAAQITAIDRAVRRTPGVIRFAHLDREDARTAFLMRNGGDWRRAADAVTDVGDFQELFWIDAFEGLDARKIRSTLATLPGVDDTWLNGGPVFTDVVRPVEQCPDTGFELVVSMRLDAAPIQRDAVRALLAGDPELTLVAEIDPAAALATFRQDFPGEYPDVRKHHFGTSFAVHTSPEVDNMFVQQLYNLAGVEGAVSSEVGCEALAAHVVNGG